jgi:hypothetical protein
VTDRMMVDEMAEEIATLRRRVRNQQRVLGGHAAQRELDAEKVPTLSDWELTERLRALPPERAGAIVARAGLSSVDGDWFDYRAECDALRAERDQLVRDLEQETDRSDKAEADRDALRAKLEAHESAPSVRGGVVASKGAPYFPESVVTVRHSCGACDGGWISWPDGPHLCPMCIPDQQKPFALRLRDPKDFLGPDWVWQADHGGRGSWVPTSALVFVSLDDWEAAREILDPWKDEFTPGESLVPQLARVFATAKANEAAVRAKLSEVEEAAESVIEDEEAGNAELMRENERLRARLEAAEKASGVAADRTAQLARAYTDTINAKADCAELRASLETAREMHSTAAREREQAIAREIAAIARAEKAEATLNEVREWLSATIEQRNRAEAEAKRWETEAKRQAYLLLELRTDLAAAEKSEGERVAKLRADLADLRATVERLERERDEARRQARALSEQANRALIDLAAARAEGEAMRPVVAAAEKARDKRGPSLGNYTLDSDGFVMFSAYAAPSPAVVFREDLDLWRTVDAYSRQPADAGEGE